MKNRFKRIVVMGNDVDRLGGVGRFMNSLAVGFDARGYEVELLGVSPAPEGHLAAYSRPAHIPSQTLMPEPPPADWTLKTDEDRKDSARVKRHAHRMKLRQIAVDKLKVLLPQWGPDTVIVCTQVYGMEHMLEAGYDATDFNLPRIVGQYHGSYREAVHTNDLRRVLTAYDDVDRFICLSAPDAADFQRAGLNNTGWLPNPVPRLEAGETERRNVFASLGRYEPIKSLDHFLRAWAVIADRLPDWSVELYGEGAERENLTALISERAIPRAQLMGMTDDVATVLASAKVHVMSSQNEGLPLAIVEAGHAGTPTVSYFSAPGVAHLIEDGHDGFVVRLNDVEQLAERMLTIASDDALLTSMSGKARVAAERFLPERVLEQWEELLLEMSR
ncbi:glycosyltransferase [Galactobacter valiniphilus]|uniref:Glycosyltransferase n=1 Tax=Galactobacter valiniphilus TaxID=2676122 RepID=A0A399J868_9MICC|nr:glycosyltransferase [Galactobacter valiniphilus]RII41765.1 glycosyltransferase [Galactobacter valiniphilus]